MFSRTKTDSTEQTIPVKIALTQILDRSFSLLFKQMHWLILFGIMLSMPYIIPAAYEYFTNSGEILPQSYYNLISIANNIIGVLFTGAMILACKNWHNESKISWSEAFAEAGRNFLRMLGTNILFVLAVIAGLICLVIPGIVIALNFACVLQVLLIERTGVIDSFKRSTGMTKGNRWRILALFITYYLVAIIIELALGVLMHFLASEKPSSHMDLVYQTLISPAIYALIAFITTYLYYDLREKKEGLDLQMLAKQIDAMECGATA